MQTVKEFLSESKVNKDLVIRYEKILQKVKDQWGEDVNRGNSIKIRDGEEYIRHAEDSLKAVKAGRQW